MRVLHVITGLGAGGAEAQLLALATARRPDAPETIVVDLLSDRGTPNAERLRAAGIELHHLGLTGATNLPRTLFRLRRLIRERAPDVVQSWMYYADIMTTLACRNRLNGGPRLYWGVRCSDMDFSRYGIRLRHTVRWCSRRAAAPDGIVVNSAAGLAAHEALGYAPRAWHLIANGIDLDRYRPDPGDRRAVRDELGLATGAPVAIHAARVDPMKDHATLLAVAERCPDTVFLAIGKGTERFSGPSNLRGLGRRADLARLYRAGDMILSTSAFGEGFSNVLAEGMASGLIPVATTVGDAADILGDTGALLAPGDIEGLAGAVREIAELDRDEQGRRGGASRARIADRFSLDRMVARFDRLHRTGAVD